jgi:hypothetical protein
MLRSLAAQGALRIAPTDETRRRLKSSWPGLGPAIHVLAADKDVDARDKPAHDGGNCDSTSSEMLYPLDSGSAMLSSERISASMPNFAAIAAATSISAAANA